ncbi:MAG TPA: FAD-binding oxidoreductase [Streptosporangiaceae bacterium]|nr:FAD-binding oxidoreductase [Streptosporangiaceae bacterium]
MADPIAVLGGVCADVRPAVAADAVLGMVPAAVAAPATVAEASEVMRAATGHGLAILPRGTGTKLAWGTRPDRCDLVVDTTRLDRVIEHAAGDLVVRVEAGLTMARLAAELGPAGQQLALDPPVSAAAVTAGQGAAGAGQGTVGGVIATGAAGPRRLRYGAPRDLLIGITVVLADGTVAASGGKVVKNVAGYDLGKLFTGSFGTLGLIAEAAFRLHPLPQTTAYVTLTCSTAADALAAVGAAVESQLVPSAAEIDRPEAGQPVSVCLLFEGTAEAITERVARMRDILGSGAQAGGAPPAWWGRSIAGADATALRIVFAPGALPFVLDAVDQAAVTAGIMGAGALRPAIRGSAGAGVLNAALDPQTSPDAAASFVAALRRRLAAPPKWGDVPGGSVTVVHAPTGIRDEVDAWGPVTAAELMQAVKDQFDPDQLMAPGRFAGGI